MLEDKIIQKYWKYFKEGEEYNLFFDRLRYNKNDIWTNDKEWIDVAKECINKGEKNELNALSILLKEEYDTFYSKAKILVDKWFEEDPHCEGWYWFYSLILYFPKDSLVRKDILDITSMPMDEFDYYCSGNEAQKLLIYSEDKDFCTLLGTFFNKKIMRLKDSQELENIIPYVAELGELADKYIDSENLQIIKTLFWDYLEKDREILLRYVAKNETFLETIARREEEDKEFERLSWIVDDIAYYSWSLGWYDILDYLKNESWYWLFVFDEGYMYDCDNRTLLSWSNYISNEILKNEAKRAMRYPDGKSEPINGAIALKRMLAIEEKVCIKN